MRRSSITQIVAPTMLSSAASGLGANASKRCGKGAGFACLNDAKAQVFLLLLDFKASDQGTGHVQ